MFAGSLPSGRRRERPRSLDHLVHEAGDPWRRRLVAIQRVPQTHLLKRHLPRRRLDELGEHRRDLLGGGNRPRRRGEPRHVVVVEGGDGPPASIASRSAVLGVVITASTRSSIATSSSLAAAWNSACTPRSSARARPILQTTSMSSRPSRTALTSRSEPSVTARCSGVKPGFLAVMTRTRFPGSRRGGCGRPRRKSSRGIPVTSTLSAFPHDAMCRAL